MNHKDVLQQFAREVGGEYDENNDRVVTRVDPWTVVLQARPHPSFTDFVMWALYRSVDGFEFKVSLKGLFHGFFGRVFGSRDIDIGDRELQKHYFVKANHEDKVRRLLTNQEFRDVWLRCGYHLVDFGLKQRRGAHAIAATLPGSSGDDFERMIPPGRLRAIRDLLVRTLHELADMGSASRDQVEFD